MREQYASKHGLEVIMRQEIQALLPQDVKSAGGCILQDIIQRASLGSCRCCPQLGLELLGAAWSSSSCLCLQALMLQG